MGTVPLEAEIAFELALARSTIDLYLCRFPRLGLAQDLRLSRGFGSFHSTKLMNALG